MAKSKIEWTEKVWNPMTGCSAVSAGCANCYARRFASRLRGRCGYDRDEPFQVTRHFDRLPEPTTWKKPSRVFVCSMGDLFHRLLDDDYRDNVFYVIDLMCEHEFYVLTKRPEAMRAYFETREVPKNCVIGVSVEDQQYIDRVHLLLRIPNARRMVSVEPMLGMVDLEGALYRAVMMDLPGVGPGIGIDWLVCGCESGPGRRPLEVEWVRILRDQCVKYEIPFFLKQLVVDGQLVKMPELDGERWADLPMGDL